MREVGAGEGFRIAAVEFPQSASVIARGGADGIGGLLGNGAAGARAKDQKETPWMGLQLRGAKFLSEELVS